MCAVVHYMTLYDIHGCVSWNDMKNNCSTIIKLICSTALMAAGQLRPIYYITILLWSYRDDEYMALIIIEMWIWRQGKTSVRCSRGSASTCGILFCLTGTQGTWTRTVTVYYSHIWLQWQGMYNKGAIWGCDNCRLPVDVMSGCMTVSWRTTQ
jgi:hypothetical protein